MNGRTSFSSFIFHIKQAPILTILYLSNSYPQTGLQRQFCQLLVLNDSTKSHNYRALRLLTKIYFQSELLVDKSAQIINPAGTARQIETGFINIR